MSVCQARTCCHAQADTDGAEQRRTPQRGGQGQGRALRRNEARLLGLVVVRVTARGVLPPFASVSQLAAVLCGKERQSGGEAEAISSADADVGRTAGVVGQLDVNTAGDTLRAPLRWAGLPPRFGGCTLNTSHYMPQSHLDWHIAHQKRFSA